MEQPHTPPAYQRRGPASAGLASLRRDHRPPDLNLTLAENLRRLVEASGWMGRPPLGRNVLGTQAEHILALAINLGVFIEGLIL